MTTILKAIVVKSQPTLYDLSRQMLASAGSPLFLTDLDVRTRSGVSSRLHLFDFKGPGGLPYSSKREMPTSQIYATPNKLTWKWRGAPNNKTTFSYTRPSIV